MAVAYSWQQCVQCGVTATPQVHIREGVSPNYAGHVPVVISFGSGVIVLRSQARPVSGFTLMHGSLRQRAADLQQTTTKHTRLKHFPKQPESKELRTKHMAFCIHHNTADHSDRWAGPKMH